MRMKPKKPHRPKPVASKELTAEMDAYARGKAVLKTALGINPITSYVILTAPQIAQVFGVSEKTVIAICRRFPRRNGGDWRPRYELPVAFFGYDRVRNRMMEKMTAATDGKDRARIHAQQLEAERQSERDRSDAIARDIMRKMREDAGLPAVSSSDRQAQELPEARQLDLF